MEGDALSGARSPLCERYERNHSMKTWNSVAIVECH